MTGRGGIYRFIFGGSVWAPWAKLTFMAYLVHGDVYSFYYFTAYQGYYVTKRVLFYMLFASTLTTYIVCVPLTAMLESPIMQLERLLIFPPKARPAKAEVPDGKEYQALSKPYF